MYARQENLSVFGLTTNTSQPRCEGDAYESTGNYCVLALRWSLLVVVRTVHIESIFALPIERYQGSFELLRTLKDH